MTTHEKAWFYFDHFLREDEKNLFYHHWCSKEDDKGLRHLDNFLAAEAAMDFGQRCARVERPKWDRAPLKVGMIPSAKEIEHDA